MTEKNLNFSIKLTIAIAVISIFAIESGFVGNEIIIKYMKYIFMTAFGAVPLFIIIKITSALFLSGIKGRSVLFVEGMYSVLRFLLTREAKKEWADYIEEEKRKLN